jgi:RHS repeat-associated protein
MTPTATHQQTDARATIALYGTYDGLNRASSVTYTAGGATAATSSVTYQYDQDFKGALSSVTAGGNATSYTHDGFGRILASTQTTAGTSYPAFQYQYSLLDDLTKITYPSGRVVQYSLDTAGRVSGVTGTITGVSTPYVSGLTYNAASAPLTIPFNNGITETHAWNDRLQHTSVSAGTSASPASLLGLNFYPCSGGLTQCPTGNNGVIWRQNISVGGSFQASQEYRYDQVNRLYAAGEQKTTGFTPSCSDTSAVWSQQFNYDAAGNRTVSCRGGNAVSPPGEVSSISAASNRILDTGWTYDAAGNITASPYAPTITYDAANRQVAFCGGLATGGACAALTQYVYDGDGQRVQTVTSSGTVTYVYDAFGNLAAEYGGTPAATGTQYVTGDHLTSTRLVMPGSASQIASGTGIERHDYYPFGYEPAYGTGTDWRTAAMGYGPSTIRQKFTGQERDTESTLDFFQARYYSAPQGRFASVDPGMRGRVWWTRRAGMGIHM